MIATRLSGGRWATRNRGKERVVEQRPLRVGTFDHRVALECRVSPVGGEEFTLTLRMGEGGHAQLLAAPGRIVPGHGDPRAVVLFEGRLEARPEDLAGRVAVEAEYLDDDLRPLAVAEAFRARGIRSDEGLSHESPPIVAEGAAQVAASEGRIATWMRIGARIDNLIANAPRGSDIEGVAHAFRRAALEVVALHRALIARVAVPDRMRRRLSHEATEAVAYGLYLHRYSGESIDLVRADWAALPDEEAAEYRRRAALTLSAAILAESHPADGAGIVESKGG